MSQIDQKIKVLAGEIHTTHSYILTTHKMSDGDGLGAMMALYHALIKLGKKVRAVTVDKTANKYRFLMPKKNVENFTHLQTPLQRAEMALIIDTNDYRRVQPLYKELKKKCQKLVYIDHHPILNTGPKPSPPSLVDTASASTGEIIYLLLKEMGVGLNKAIAQALYVSILFDTQRFQFIRNSTMSHKISAELLPYIKDNEVIYNQLFGFRSTQKLNMLAKAIHKTEYYCRKKVAILEISKSALNKNNLDIEDACDFLDMNLEVRSTKLSILIVRLSQNEYKISFRSKKGNVSQLAEIFGGGGHKHASGANLVHYTKDPKAEILKTIQTKQNWF